MATHALPLPAAMHPREHEIRSQQLKIHFQFSPYRLAIHFVVATAVTAVLWEVVPLPRLVTWYVALTAVLAGCAALVNLFHHQAAGQSHPLWQRYVMVSGLVVGLLWGAGGVLLFPYESLEHQMLLLLLLIGLGTGSLSSSVYLPQFYSFFPLAMLPITVVLLVQGTAIHTAAAMVTMLFVTMYLISAREPARRLLNMVRLQVENDDLLEQLRLQKTQAEQASVAKSKFLAAASHDLRQPLHALMLFTSALDQLTRRGAQRRIVDNIKTSVGAMEELFNALLDISRLDAGVLQPEIDHFDLSVLTERLANDFTPEAQAKGLALQVGTCNLVVHSDATLLERILRNFVSNAIRYTHHGGVKIHCVRRDESVRIDVVDTGIGIPHARQQEIFDEFHQLDNAERDRAKGLGLGLAIVERMARLLDHAIGLHSVPGKGSCFSITVPPGDPAVAAGDEVPWADAVLSDLVGLRAMVIDDEVGGREGMRALLELWGCEVSLAGSEEEAVGVVRASGHFPDALIVDYRLRDGRNGMQAIERLRRECRPGIPALIVTGDTAADRLREVRASGYQLVHKPVQPAMLRAFLRNARKRKPAPPA